MKKSIRILSLLLVVSLVCAMFASCKPADTNEPTTEGEEVTTKKENTGANGTLVVGIGPDFDYIPYKYKDGDKLTGINIDFINAVADELNMYVDFIEINAHSSQYKPENLKVDILLNRTEGDINDMKNAKLSKAYVSDIQSVVVKASSEFNLYDDFYAAFDNEGYPVGLKDDIKIGVKKTTTGDIYASAPFKEWGFGQENLKEYTTNDEMVNALKNGEVTAIVTDDELARNILNKVSGFKILDSSFYSAEYRAAVVSEDAEKQTEILDAINKLVDNGTAKKIVSKYMKY